MLSFKAFVFLLALVAGQDVPVIDEKDTPFMQEIMPHLESMGPRSVAKIMHNVPVFQEDLKAMLGSTPKNDEGNLGRSAVRYALNRLFIQRHGWFVNGLFTAGAKWNASLAGDLSFMEDLVPRAALNLFEKQLSAQGLDGKQVALLGSIVEETVLSEARAVLTSNYKLLHVPTSRNVSRAQAQTLVSIHLMKQITQADESICPTKYGGKFLLRCLQTVTEQVDPNWPKTVQFLRDLQQEVVPAEKQSLDFESVALVATAIESRWGRWTASRNCKSLKDKLIKIEEGHNTGCVSLSTFYERSLNPQDGWQFKETPEYLRELGALDETQPKDPKILIPNYVNALANCFSSGKYYQSCCINECEGLQAQIESAVQTSSAHPDDIISIVKQLSSSTVAATGDLPLPLRRHLQEIAELHGGRVPLQGRMFAQWLHFAYPHECPYPHISGSTHQVGLDLTSDTQFVSDAVVARTIEEGKHVNHTETTGTCMQWRSEEELFVPTERAMSRSLRELAEEDSVWELVRSMALFSMFGLLMTTAMTSTRRIRTVCKGRPEDLKPCYFV
eukprot:TRINITY_DN428_c0_g2_i3.p1 TRINITY_DN428_c0_g2~~TRINITY_DN428_c0_g2_i3.p1  ORF type:complete len:558 (-),score=121.29 TRINITY_DN428_c0_g2_i3:66-1739(-)